MTPSVITPGTKDALHEITSKVIERFGDAERELARLSRLFRDYRRVTGVESAEIKKILGDRGDFLNTKRELYEKALEGTLSADDFVTALFTDERRAEENDDATCPEEAFEQTERPSQLSSRDRIEALLEKLTIRVRFYEELSAIQARFTELVGYPDKLIEEILSKPYEHHNGRLALALKLHDKHLSILNAPMVLDLVADRIPTGDKVYDSYISREVQRGIIERTMTEDQYLELQFRGGNVSRALPTNSPLFLLENLDAQDRSIQAPRTQAKEHTVAELLVREEGQEDGVITSRIKAIEVHFKGGIQLGTLTGSQLLALSASTHRFLSLPSEQQVNEMLPFLCRYVSDEMWDSLTKAEQRSLQYYRSHYGGLNPDEVPHLRDFDVNRIVGKLLLFNSDLIKLMKDAGFGDFSAASGNPAMFAVIRFIHQEILPAREKAASEAVYDAIDRLLGAYERAFPNEKRSFNKYDPLNVLESMAAWYKECGYLTPKQRRFAVQCMSTLQAKLAMGALAAVSDETRGSEEADVIEGEVVDDSSPE